MVTEKGPHPLAKSGAIAARCEPRRSSPAVPSACHKERSTADRSAVRPHERLPMRLVVPADGSHPVAIALAAPEPFFV
jgi:hypothetical protein